MKLTDLNPELHKMNGTGYEWIKFDCPKCGDTKDVFGFKHTIDIPVDPEHPKHWDMSTRDFETMTIRPSVQDLGKCKVHFYVTDGQIEILP